MRNVTLLALGLMFVGAWPHDGARGQTSAAPPVSLAPPDASPPHEGANKSKPKRAPATVTNKRTPTAREPTPPVIGGPAAMPNPAADYDGFSASTDGNDAPSQVTPPARSSAGKGSSIDSQSLIDQDDEALKRKLTICKNCK
ncbi:hypothetical protein [Bradyrhizobium glycinis]|uniref:hypothetical protein n=1 Tax=Bradyrhizobium glycinis TaxID=2751812 RepID=UPI0018D70F9D|nr:hypothetical protein [Bradyrhizobium glycinis]MBH5366600.1 hypothetical protein [Bradyrhizobium glycinis]